MGRLLNWPTGLKWTAREPLSGPRTASAGTTEGTTGFIQTVSASFGLWRWSFAFPPLRGSGFRRYRGLITALHGGANAVRVPFSDPDGLGWREAGTLPYPGQVASGQPWTNTLPWANGERWRVARPRVAVAAAAARGDSTIVLAPAFWGHGLDMGDMLGFAPSHFGVYSVTERVQPGQYRIWPPLRAAITPQHFATLDPVMVMRLESEGAGTASRGPVFAESPGATFVEVEDPDVRTFYGD